MATDARPAATALTGFDTPRGGRAFGRYLLLAFVAFVVLFPIYTTIVAALKPGNEVLNEPLRPGPFTLDVLRDAWSTGRLGRYLLNSFVVAVIVIGYGDHLNKAVPAH